MKTVEIEQFRKEFKSIVYQYSLISSSNDKLKKLHTWDKNGSHEKAILKELDVKKELQAKLKTMLKGVDYEEWKFVSKRLSNLSNKLKTATANKLKCETEISKIIFPNN